MSIPVTLPANISTMFTEFPLLERPSAAHRAGFSAIEVWWPFGASSQPSTDEVDGFIDAIRASGTALIAMNLYAGDMPAGDRGVVAHVDHEDEFLASLSAVERVAGELGTKLFNVPYGHRLDGVPARDQDDQATKMIAEAMKRFRSFDATILLEALSGFDRYPLLTADQVAARVHTIRAASGLSNLGMLLDQYHLEKNGDNAVSAVTAHTDVLTHIQIADLPDRGEPGSGAYDFRRFKEALDVAEYTGYIALECAPQGETVEGISAHRQTWKELLLA